MGQERGVYMKSFTRSLLVSSLAALSAMVLAPVVLAQVPPDETAGFSVQSPLRVGSVVLAPGDYLVRAVRAEADRGLLVVTEPTKTSVFAIVLATPHQIQPWDIKPVSRLRFQYDDSGRPNVLRTFLIANSRFGYDIVGVAAPGNTAALKIGTLDAVVAAR